MLFCFVGHTHDPHIHCFAAAATAWRTPHGFDEDMTGQNSMIFITLHFQYECTSYFASIRPFQRVISAWVGYPSIHEIAVDGTPQPVLPVGVSVYLRRGLGMRSA